MECHYLDILIIVTLYGKKNRCDRGTEYVAVKLLGLAICKLEASGSYFRLET
jgi:hypothetical protein